MKTLALAILFALTLPLMAAVGDTVPKEILPQVWVRGTPPQTWPTDELWLIECWATWCGPCIASIPHLEELWKQVQPHKIRIVGLNVGDRKTPEELKQFLAKQRIPPTYPIAIDTCDRFAAALKLRSIPTAYAVKNGKVLWQGNPRALTAEKLLQLNKGETAPVHTAPKATQCCPSGRHPRR
ncbi:MAG: TlpA family protein disulfide reductase [Kiritimatiellae bacterium]|nr:TlpA family protein disulfide reductase [Kiritimatiellia bacterium]